VEAVPIVASKSRFGYCSSVRTGSVIQRQLRAQLGRGSRRFRGQVPGGKVASGSEVGQMYIETSSRLDKTVASNHSMYTCLLRVVDGVDKAEAEC
jgi:hypothetical protein